MNRCAAEQSALINVAGPRGKKRHTSVAKPLSRGTFREDAIGQREAHLSLAALKVGRTLRRTIAQADRVFSFRDRNVLNLEKGDFNYVLFLGNAWAVVDFLGVPLDFVLFFHDARKAGNLPPNAVSFAAPAKKICRRGNHRRGIRRTADQTAARRQYEIAS